MRLPVDTSSIAFLCALEPQPVLAFDTKQPRADENGEPLYVVQLIALAEGEAEILARSPASPPRPSARATRSRSPAWSPSPGPGTTARGWRFVPPGSSRPCPRPRPASRKEAMPERP